MCAHSQSSLQPSLSISSLRLSSIFLLSFSPPHPYLLLPLTFVVHLSLYYSLAVFFQAYDFNQDISNWNVGSVTNMVYSKCVPIPSLVYNPPYPSRCVSRAPLLLPPPPPCKVHATARSASTLPLPLLPSLHPRQHPCCYIVSYGPSFPASPPASMPSSSNPPSPPASLLLPDPHNSSPSSSSPSSSCARIDDAQCSATPEP